MSNETNSTGDATSFKNVTTFTFPTSMNTAVVSAETASMSSAPINNPEGHQVTRANTEAGDVSQQLIQLHVNHIGAKLRNISSLSTVSTTYSDGAASFPLLSNDTEDSVVCPEFSNWGEDAEQLVRAGLAKLAQLANDENKNAPEKSIEQYFSEHLSKLLAGCDIKFDPSYLK